MKDIGRTNNGGYLVEMTETEHRVFQELSIAAQGKTIRGDMMFSYPGLENNLDNALVIVKEFTTSRIRINELREAVADLEGIVSTEKSGTP